MKTQILWSVYKNRQLTGAMPWKLVREMHGDDTHDTVAVRRDNWGRLIAKSPYSGEALTVSEMERDGIWSLHNLP